MVNHNDYITNFALTFAQLKPQIETDYEKFFTFIQDYITALQPTDFQQTQSKSMSDKISSKYEAYKQSGTTALKPVVGLVEGVFDMLHFGHFNAIRQASLCCDKLIVGVNCDETVRKNKG